MARFLPTLIFLFAAAAAEEFTNTTTGKVVTGTLVGMIKKDSVDAYIVRLADQSLRQLPRNEWAITSNPTPTKQAVPADKSALPPATESQAGAGKTQGEDAAGWCWAATTRAGVVLTLKNITWADAGLPFEPPDHALFSFTVDNRKGSLPIAASAYRGEVKFVTRAGIQFESLTLADMLRGMSPPHPGTSGILRSMRAASSSTQVMPGAVAVRTVAFPRGLQLSSIERVFIGSSTSPVELARVPAKGTAQEAPSESGIGPAPGGKAGEPDKAPPFEWQKVRYDGQLRSEVWLENAYQKLKDRIVLEHGKYRNLNDPIYAKSRAGIPVPDTPIPREQFVEAIRSGLQLFYWRPCPNCEGKGHLLVRKWRPSGMIRESYTEEKSCPECSGKKELRVRSIKRE